MEKNGYKKTINFTFNFNTKNFSFFSRYINMLLKCGNKAKVEIGFFGILRSIKKEKQTYILTKYLTKAINTARPVLALVAKKKGGRSYKIPVALTMRREIFQGIYWTIKETCGLKRGEYSTLLLHELLNLSKRVGNVMRVKNELYKVAKKNRIYIAKYYLK